MSIFSLAIYHRRDSRPRVRCLNEMLEVLAPSAQGVPCRIWDERATESWDAWQHTLHPRVWGWSLEHSVATHHVFMTDDLAICPRFWDVLRAMTTAKPEAIIGLLSNHPAGPRLAAAGAHWYRCNSWIVGPAYVVPRMHLERFLPWYREWIECQEKRHYGDDSSLNVWISSHGPRESWHPLPTIIEHRGDIESTWQSGDCFSRERVSWRAHRWAPLREDYRGLWTSEDKRYDLDAMSRPTYWEGLGPVLDVGGAREEEAERWRGDPITVPPPPSEEMGRVSER